MNNTACATSSRLVFQARALQSDIAINGVASEHAIAAACTRGGSLPAYIVARASSQDVYPAAATAAAHT